MATEQKLHLFQIYSLIPIGVTSVLIYGAIVQFYILSYVFNYPSPYCFVFFASLLVSTILSGILVDRTRDNLKKFYFLSFIAEGMLLMASPFLASTLLTMIIFQSLMGLFSGISTSFGLSYVNSTLTLERRGMLFGGSVALGFVFLAIVTGTWILDRTGLIATLFLGFLNALVGIINFLIVHISRKAIVLNKQIKIPKTINVKMNLLAYFIGLLLFGGLLGLFLVLLTTPDELMRHEIEGVFYFENLSPWLDMAAMFNVPFLVFTFTASGLVIPLLSLVFGKLMDKYGRKGVFLLSNVLISLEVLIFAGSGNIVFSILFMIFLGILTGNYFQLVYIVFADLAPKTKIAKYTGMGYAAFIGGTILGMAIVYLLLTPAVTPLLDYVMLFFSNAVIMVSFVPFAFMKETLPPREELQWMYSIISIHVIHSSGIAVYYYPFGTEAVVSGAGVNTKQTVDNMLFSGGVAGITTILKEMIKSKNKVEYIDHQDKKLMFQHGNGFVVVLLTKKMLHILRSKLKQLTEDIERVYGDTILNWDGCQDAFSQLDKLIKNNFEER